MQLLVTEATIELVYDLKSSRILFYFFETYSFHEPLV